MSKYFYTDSEYLKYKGEWDRLNTKIRRPWRSLGRYSSLAARSFFVLGIDGAGSTRGKGIKLI
jgi:hypothetical protein